MNSSFSAWRGAIPLVALSLSLLSTTACLQILTAMAPGVSEVEDGISPEFPYASKFIEVKGSRMHYVEAGTGDPIILLHGNPTSSYLWRNVIPGLKDSGRVIAPDLIGMGKSDKPDIEYTFQDHVAYFAAFMDAMALKNVTLVLHDWGGGVGSDYAASNLENVRAIVYMEAVMKPMPWDAANAVEKYIFGRFRDPADGHQLIAVENFFVEKMLVMMSGREFSETEMNVYRAPFPTVESRKPVAMWPREIPFIGDGPDRNIQRIGANYNAIRESKVPVLMLYASPGAIFKEDFVQAIKAEMPRVEQRFIGEGLHYLQETKPGRIAQETREWLAGLP